MNDLAEKIGNICGKTERSVKFHAVRMVLEIEKKEHLSVKDQKRIYNKMNSWKPSLD